MISLKKVYTLPPQVRQIMSKSANTSFKIDFIHKKGILVFDTSKIMVWSLDNTEKSTLNFLSLTSRSSFINERPFKADNVFIFGPESEENNNLLSVLAIHPLGTVAYWKNAISIVDNFSQNNYSANSDEIFVIPPTKSIEYGLVDDYFACAVPCINDDGNDDGNDSDDSDNNRNEFLVGSERGTIYKVIIKPFLTVIEIYKNNVFRDEIALRIAKENESSKSVSSSTGFFGLLKYGWWSSSQTNSKNSAQKMLQNDKFCCFVDTRNDLIFITEKLLVIYSAGSFKDYKNVENFANSDVYSNQQFLGSSIIYPNDGNEFTTFIMANKKDGDETVILTCTVSIINDDDDDHQHQHYQITSKIDNEVIVGDEFKGNICRIVSFDKSVFVCLVNNGIFAISGDNITKLKQKKRFFSLSKKFVVSDEAILCLNFNESDDNNNDEEDEIDEDEERMEDMEGREGEENNENDNNNDDDIIMNDNDDDNQQPQRQIYNIDGIVEALFNAVIKEDIASFNKVIGANASIFENRKDGINILSATSNKLVNCGCDDLPEWFRGDETSKLNDVLFSSKVVEKKYALHNMMFANWIGKEYYNNVIAFNIQSLDAMKKLSSFQSIVENKQNDNIMTKCNPCENWTKFYENSSNLFTLLNKMISSIDALPNNEGNYGLDLEIVSHSLILVINSYNDKILQSFVFSNNSLDTTLDEKLFHVLYNKVLLYLESQRKVSPEIFTSSQLCSSLLGCLEKLCKRYLAYKRSTLKYDESPDDGKDSPIKSFAKLLLYRLAALSPDSAQNLAEEYAEFYTLYYLCCHCRSVDFELINRYIQKWSQFESFVYESWLHDKYFHKYFFDPRLEPRRSEIRAFLCKEEHLSELTTTFLLEFNNVQQQREVLREIVDGLLSFAQEALFVKKKYSDALDFAVAAKMLLFACSLEANSPEYVLSKFIELIVTSQKNKNKFELDPVCIIKNVLLVPDNADESDSDDDECDCGYDGDDKCFMLRSALDFVNMFGYVIEHSDIFTNAYCQVLENDLYKDKENTWMELGRIVFENAFEATNWEKVASSNDTDRNSVLEYLINSPIVDLGRYAFFGLERPKEFVCKVVYEVTKGQKLIPVVLDLMFTKYEPPAFINSLDVDDDDDNVMEEEEGDDDDNN